MKKMAAIDKFYTTSKEKAKELTSFIESVGKVSLGMFNNREYFFEPADYLYVRSDYNFDEINWENGYPLWNSPCFMDRWLWHNCSDSDVLEDLKWKYGITDDMSNEEIDKQFVNIPEFKSGERYTVIKKMPRGLRRGAKVLWGVYVNVPGNTLWWYNSDVGVFVPFGLPYNSSCMTIEKEYLSHGFIKRFLKKNKFPIGTTIEFRCAFTEMKIKVK